MNLNLLLGNIARSLGFEVRRAGSGFHRDAFDDQRILLSDRRVIHTILDVGANVGQTAKRYRDLFPTSTIHCFEPFDESYLVLQHNFATDLRIIPHRLAIADAPGPKTLFVNQSSVTNSLLPPSPEAFDYVDERLLSNINSVKVPSTTLDIFCAEQNINALPILKMDIQDGELLALRGAASLLTAGAIDLIYTEVSFASLYDHQAVFCDLYQHLSEHHYALYGLYNFFIGTNSLLAQADAIFVSPNMRESLQRKRPAAGK
jgi:FkbM family methyltransferase